MIYCDSQSSIYKYVIYCDSESPIYLAKHPKFHWNAKHIDLKYHWIWHVLEEEQLSLEKIHIDRNPADMLTKILPQNKHELCRGMVGLGVIWWLLFGFKWENVKCEAKITEDSRLDLFRSLGF